MGNLSLQITSASSYYLFERWRNAAIGPTLEGVPDTHLCSQRPHRRQGQQEEGRKGSYTCFELCFEVFRAFSMGNPQGSNINNTALRISISVTHWEANSGLKFRQSRGSLVAMCWNISGLLHKNYYCSVLPRPNSRIHHCRRFPNKFSIIMIAVLFLF
jgi:hypothetical protein